MKVTATEVITIVTIVMNAIDRYGYTILTYLDDPEFLNTALLLCARRLYGTYQLLICTFYLTILGFICGMIFGVLFAALSALPFIVLFSPAAIIAGVVFLIISFCCYCLAKLQSDYVYYWWLLTL